jgi:SET domain-containing protein
MIHPALFFDQSANRGRGVYTSAAIPADTIVELSPVIVMSKEDRKLIDQTRLHDYIFEWLPDGKEQCCMAQGYISLYNHSPASNCEYFMNYEEETIQVKTMRAIAAGEELTINYNGDWNDKNPVWFDVSK